MVATAFCAQRIVIIHHRIHLTFNPIKAVWGSLKCRILNTFWAFKFLFQDNDATVLSTQILDILMFFNESLTKMRLVKFLPWDLKPVVASLHQQTTGSPNISELQVDSLCFFGKKACHLLFGDRVTSNSAKAYKILLKLFLQNVFSVGSVKKVIPSPNSQVSYESLTMVPNC